MYERLIEKLRDDTMWKDCEFDFIYSYMHKAADAIEDLIKDRDMYIKAMTDEHNRAARLAWEHRWIPVTDRLPEEDTDVLVVRKFLGIDGLINPCTYVEIASRIGEEWVSDSDEYKCARSKHTDPTHWMLLPEPPKEGET